MKTKKIIKKIETFISNPSNFTEEDIIELFKETKKSIKLLKKENKKLKAKHIANDCENEFDDYINDPDGYIM